MKIRIAPGLFVVGFIGVVATGVATAAPEDVLIETATVKVTRGDYEAELQRLPAVSRGGFATDRKRVAALLNNMLIGKTLAAEARTQGLDRDALVQRRIALETDKILAEAEVQRIERLAGEEFDAKLAQYVPKARERYLIDKDRYSDPEEVEASHILILTNKRSESEALALAQQAETKLAAGADFAGLAKEMSEDRTTKDAGGHLGWFSAKQMEPAFSTAAFALKNAGDISAPVLSRYGYHVIRLEGRRPQRQRSFDEVKDRVLADMRLAYVNEQRSLKMQVISSDPTLKVSQGAVDSLIVQLPDSATLQRLMKE
jgi:peptidyl-prolyl cis-trans isomerase C